MRAEMRAEMMIGHDRGFETRVNNNGEVIDPKFDPGVIAQRLTTLIGRKTL